MKIKVKLFNAKCGFEAIDKGEWIDLKAAQRVELGAPYAHTLGQGRNSKDCYVP